MKKNKIITVIAMLMVGSLGQVAHASTASRQVSAAQLQEFAAQVGEYAAWMQPIKYGLSGRATMILPTEVTGQTGHYTDVLQKCMCYAAQRGWDMTFPEMEPLFDKGFEKVAQINEERSANRMPRKVREDLTVSDITTLKAKIDAFIDNNKPFLGGIDVEGDECVKALDKAELKAEAARANAIEAAAKAEGKADSGKNEL